MCYPKPGPRCAAHVRAAIATVEKQIAENRAAFANGDVPPHRLSPGRLMELQDEFDETRTGQAELAGRLNALENADEPDLHEIDRLRARMLRAADRRAAKLAALKSAEAGDTKAAAAQAKYGAHAGWLGHARILEDAQGTPAVFYDYAVGYISEDNHAETAGYEERARDFMVTDRELIYEAPVTPGPRPGTWIVGANAERHNRSAALLERFSYDHGFNRSNRRVDPVIVDTADNTVARFDTSSSLSLGTPVEVGSNDGISVLDYNGGWESLYLGDREPPYLDRIEATLTLDQSGPTPVLRVILDTTETFD